MAIAVRELPPTRLSINISPNAGDVVRWAADERRAENIPSGLSFTSSAPGGFESCSLTLPRRPRLSYPDLERLSTVTVSGAGGEIAWEGRVENVPQTSGDTSGVSPEIVGWQAHLSDDKSVTALYVDRDLGNWIQKSSAGRSALYGAYFDVYQDHTVDPDMSTGLPAIHLHADGQWDTGVASEAWYDCGLGNTWESIYVDYSGFGLGGANFQGMITSYTSDAGSGALSSSDFVTVASPTGTLTYTPSATQRFCALQLLLAGVASGADIDRFLNFRRVAIWGNTGITKRGTAPDDGVYASDVIAHVLANFAPRLSFTRGTYGTIQTSGFTIPHLVFPDPTTAAEIVSAANRYHLNDWFVWEGPRPGIPTLYYHARGARGRNWRARVGPSQLAETGQAIENLWNGVIVRYQDVDGTTMSVGPTGSTRTNATSALLLDSDPDNAANRAGIRRWEVLDMGSVSTLAGATEVGRRFLIEARQFNTSGQAQIVGHCEDDRGIVHPAWKIRPGDTVVFTDAASTAPRRVIKTSYSDESKTNSIDLDAPPDALAALLERLQVVLVPLGL